MAGKRPIGVGAVGVLPGEEEGLLAEMPVGPHFQLVAFSDEGLEGGAPEQRPVRYYSDYNMVLQDPSVELVLVGGPLELRRDFAVRALNAGRHAALSAPFCETALGAERVMKTAFHAGLVATMDMKWRDDPDLRGLRLAMGAENIGPVQGAQLFWRPPEREDPPAEGLLAREGFALLDQLNIVIREDVRDVTTHLLAPGPNRPDEGFLLYLSLRNGGWGLAEAAPNQVEALPRWTLHTASATFCAREGVVLVSAGDQRRTYRAPSAPESFWDNLYSAVRGDAELKCHPLEIVRAMKLHEAALESAETGLPVTI
ncbi:MAG: Gfo/Idh/MocA family oxidoreductase [Candidatus Brocadiaceae bacterium]|jgi:predicted dehydrogenase